MFRKWHRLDMRRRLSSAIGQLIQQLPERVSIIKFPMTVLTKPEKVCHQFIENPIIR
jgi:hypothetical protein